jgi:hypothetical protein
MRELVGFAGDDCCLNRELLGISSLLANVADAEDRITDLEIGDTLAQRGDDAGEVPARYVWKVRYAGVIAPGAHLPVGAVDACRMNVHDNVAGACDGIGHVAVLQDLRTSGLHEQRGLHRCLDLS